MTRTLLLTGPVRSITRWIASAEDAGWRGLEFPLLEQIAVEHARADGPLPDWVLFTSTAGVEHFGDPGPLAAVACGVVGEATRAAARRAGWDVRLVSAGTAETLAADLIESGGVPGARILWPRGDLAHELGERLRAAGAEVEAPVVYRTVTRPASDAPPPCDAVFFASPSAVAAWSERWAAPRRVLAIGTTTAAAIEAAGWGGCEVLDEPSAGALARRLAQPPA